MGQADYLPVLAAAEVDLLLGPSWPMRPGRSLQLVLQELVGVGSLRRSPGRRAWPVQAVPGAEPPSRWITASVHRLFLQDGGLTAEAFAERMASAFEDPLEARRDVPGGHPLHWFTAALENGLIGDGLAELVEEPGYQIGDTRYGTRTGLGLTPAGRAVAGVLEPLRRPPNRLLRRARRPVAADGLPFLVDLVADVGSDLFRPDPVFFGG